MEIQEQLAAFEQRITSTLKREMLSSLKKEITLKIREEIKSSLIEHMDKNHKESMSKMDILTGKVDSLRVEVSTGFHEVKAELATGFLQTHSLLSNITGILDKMLTHEKQHAELLKSNNEVLKSNTELLKVIAENTKK